MPIQVKKAQPRTAQVKVEFEGETATVNYRTGVVSNRDWREMGTVPSKKGEGPPVTWNMELLLKTVIDWDITMEAGGPPVPITAKALDDLPIELIAAVVRGIVGAIFPNRTTESESSSF